MIFVLEVPHQGAPHAWFAYGSDDLLGKVAADDSLEPWEIYDCATPRELFDLVGALPGSPEATAGFPGLSRLADAFGLDTPLFRADYLLERGCYQPESVALDAACEAALRSRVGPPSDGRSLRDCRLYWSEPEAVLALEGADPFLVDPPNWRARHALREQLLALDVIAAD